MAIIEARGAHAGKEGAEPLVRAVTEELKRRISGDVITLTVRGDPDAARSLLAEHPGVREIVLDGRSSRLAVEPGRGGAARTAANPGRGRGTDRPGHGLPLAGRAGIRPRERLTAVIS